MNEQQFDLSIRADGYDSAALHKLSVIGAQEGELLRRLRTSAPLLLEGIRGTGKTTLLKLAAEATNATTKSEGHLAVYVSFSRYLLLENPRIPVGPSHPFIIWVCTKILNQVWDTAAATTGHTPDIPGVAPFLKAHFETIIDSLELTHKVGGLAASPLSTLPLDTQQALDSFSNPDTLRTLLEQIITRPRPEVP